VSIDDSQTVDQQKIIQTIGMGMMALLKACPFVASVEAVHVEERRFRERSSLDQ
jgi:hypothetical protein